MKNEEKENEKKRVLNSKKEKEWKDWEWLKKKE